MRSVPPSKVIGKKKAGATRRLFFGAQLDAALAGLLADSADGAGMGDGVAGGDGDGAGLAVLGVGTEPSLGPAGFLSHAARPLVTNTATTIDDKVFFMVRFLREEDWTTACRSVARMQLADLPCGFATSHIFRSMGS